MAQEQLFYGSPRAILFRCVHVLKIRASLTVSSGYFSKVRIFLEILLLVKY